MTEVMALDDTVNQCEGSHTALSTARAHPS